MNMNRTITLNEDSKNIHLYQNMIILIMLFAPFTSLRLLRIGVTETMSLVLFLFVLLSKYKIKFNDNNTFIFTKFWIFFFFTSGIGLFYNYILMAKTSGTVEGLLFDTVSYIIVFLTCLSLEMILYNKENIQIDYILHKIFIYSSFILIILFIISKFTGTMLLDGAGNFRPLADNVHHVAMFIGPLPFIGLYFWKQRYNGFPNILYFILVASNSVIIFNVGSDKAIMGFYFGGFILIFSLFIEKIGKYDKKYFYPLLIVILLLLIISNYESIVYSITTMFAESDGEGAREALYTRSISKSTNSFLFGYGPGQHAPTSNNNNFADTHSTFLTVLLQSGIFGIIIFVVFLMKIINEYKRNVYLLAAFLSIFIYIVGGDILRRLPMWVYMILFYYKIKSDNNTLNR